MSAPKRGAQPVKRTPAQKAAATKAAKKAEAESLSRAETQRLAQLANLLIAGYSLAEIGEAIGASADEVDKMLNKDMARYVRNQPALRVFVRNFLTEKYMGLLDAVYTEATDRNHPEKLENSAQALRILNSFGRLHGAEAPTQSEVKIETSPEAVDAIVAQIAAGQGMGYDDSVFDVVPGSVVHEAAVSAPAATLDAAEMVGEETDDDESW